MVSVIVPVHNGEKYISKCIDSILKSTYKDIEIIIVENASTDSTLEICNNYQEKYSNVNVLVSDMASVSHARNIGIKNAKGKYIAFVDADDYISEYMYEKMVECAEKNSSDFVMCDYFMGNEESYSFESDKECKIEKLPVDDYYFKMFLQENMIVSITCNKLFLKDILTENNISFNEEISYAEDKLFSSEYALKVKNIFYINDKLYYYFRGNEESISNSGIQKFRMDMIYANEKCAQAVKGNPKWYGYAEANLYSTACFRYQKAKEAGLKDLQAELKPIIKKYRTVALKSKYIPIKYKIIIYGRVYFPNVLRFIEKIHR